MSDACTFTTSLLTVGTARTPVAIVDGWRGSAALAEAAKDLGAYPPARGNSYPGLRRQIRPVDRTAAALAQETLRALVPVINRLFDAAGFDLLDASFSLVTLTAAGLAPIQRAPHFDAADPRHLAVLHYLSGVTGSGTAFFRHRATAIERIDPANQATFLAAAEREAPDWQGYIAGSNAWFEEIGRVPALPGRIAVYPGSLLHSGLIPPDAPLSPDPRTGRLTANYFLRTRPRQPG